MSEDDVSLDANVLALEVLHRIFAKIDTDGNKRISIEELTVALTDLGFDSPRTVAEQVMVQADTDLSGDLDFDEFAEVMALIEQRGLADSFGLLFHGFDKDADGTIDEYEFREMFAFLGVEVDDAEIKVLFDNADADNDGRIDPIEALEALKRL
ncbi:MAG: EF-hand domain-containing protein [Deltaproteobacteria bacterium]|nr:EF-hand domain-containing protein [Deltaproteobacteria bacterium]